MYKVMACILCNNQIYDHDGERPEMTVAVLGAGVLVVSFIGALVWTRRTLTDRQGQPKVLLFGLYFWILFFIQLILVAIGYSLGAD